MSEQGIGSFFTLLRKCSDHFGDLPWFHAISIACVCVRSSILGDKTEVILLQKLNEPLSLESGRRDPPKTAFTSNTGELFVCVCVEVLQFVIVIQKSS